MIYKDKRKEKLFKVSSIDNVDSNIAGDFLQNVASNLVDEISASPVCLFQFCIQ
ncbi:hypothetical protein M9Y10_028915 [Tritrichomonas musculus]|uniref:Uncharacterized protein n=1 Tax=Tritrichomonas musculus TaxID=1915356 RepID=A0ABR2KNY8_9EUKA